MIVDDHVVIRSGLRMLIEHDQHMRVVAMAGNQRKRSNSCRREAGRDYSGSVLGDEDALTFLPELCESSPNRGC